MVKLLCQATSGTGPLDGAIANGTLELASGSPPPLALFTAPRLDCPLHRLRHRTGTVPDHFQNFVLFTMINIGMRPVELLRQERPSSLHSRKLRSFADVAFP